jgi:hypothetical protein
MSMFELLPFPLPSPLADVDPRSTPSTIPSPFIVCPEKKDKMMEKMGKQEIRSESVKPIKTTLENDVQAMVSAI